MSRPLVTRATSLATSTGLLALAIAAALSATFTVRQISNPDTPTFTTVDPPPTPTPPIAHPTPPAPIPRAHLDATAPSSSTTEPTQPQQTSGEPLAPPGPPTITDPHWLQIPHDLARYYPARAAEAAVQGSATLDCIVDISGRLNCTVISETPTDWGFGRAALRLSQDYRMAPARRDGQPLEVRYRMRVPFQLN